MIITLHQNSAEHREPLLAAPLFLESPIVAPVDASRLQRLHALMFAAGLDLEPTRMVYDRTYAYERLAAGFGSDSETLRQFAIDVFADYQDAGEWIGLIH